MNDFVHGRFVGQEWRVALQSMRDGVPLPMVGVERTAPYRTEKVARKAAERLNARYGTTYQRYVAVQVDLRVMEMPS